MNTPAPSAARTRLTTAAAAVLFVGGTYTGVQLLTSGDAAPETAASCTDRTIAAGEAITPNLIPVRVLNGSGRSGLANRISINLQRRGFLGDKVGNSSSQVPVTNVTILTTDQNDPRVQLVAQQFTGEIAYAQPDVPTGDSVTVLIGAAFTDLAPEGVTEVPAPADLTICVPSSEL